MSTQNLRVVRPHAITPPMLISTNVLENDYAEWSAATSYGVGDRVMVTSQHKIYQSLSASNQNKPPALSVADWVEVGPTNRWKAFDTSNSTQTKRAGLISYRIRPGAAVHAVAALNLTEATSIRVRVNDPLLGTIYDVTTPLAGQLITSSWWDWFFGPRTQPKQAVLTNLPSAPSADILVDIEGNDGLAVGVIALGQLRTFSLGVQRGARIGIQDYSRKERNEFGDAIFVERAFARRASFSMLLQASEVDAFNDFLADVRAVPCLWIGSNKYEATTVYGFYKSFDIVLSYSDFSDCELELEGLT
ncbi:MAG: carbohydrate-binding protein [Pseudorhodoferax sp.]